MDIEAFRGANRTKNYVLTRHSRQRMAERGIRLRDVICAIDGGEIIEEYPEDFPFPSCLILGRTGTGEALHVVSCLDGGWIYLITAYFPDPGQWESDMKTRKEARE